MQKLKWTAYRVHCVKTKKIVMSRAARTPSFTIRRKSSAPQLLSSVEQSVYLDPDGTQSKKQKAQQK